MFHEHQAHALQTQAMHSLIEKILRLKDSSSDSPKCGTFVYKRAQSMCACREGCVVGRKFEIVSSVKFPCSAGLWRASLAHVMVAYLSVWSWKEESLGAAGSREHSPQARLERSSVEAVVYLVSPPRPSRERLTALVLLAWLHQTH